MRIDLEVRTAVILLLAVLLVLSVGSAVAVQFTGELTADEDYSDDTVELDDGSELWPYTSQSHAFEDRTLSLNVVIYGDTEHTAYILQEAPFADWDDVPEEREDIAPAEGQDINETTLGWGGAHGSDRYIWVNPADGSGPMWLGESYQLEQGDYLGQRQHIRAYDDPANGDWTALQGHDEHWDWFHLRHTVHSIEDTQSSIEKQLADRWYLEEYHRAHFKNDQSSDADGWVTIVSLDSDLLSTVLGSLVIVMGGVTATTSRDIRQFVQSDPVLHAGLRALSVVIALVAAYFAIRFGAIALERRTDGIDPALIVAVFYPLLIVGMPVIAYLTSRRLEATVAFWAATIGFVGAIMIDYTYLEVIRLPMETFIHRFALAIAIGLIAAGASHTARYPGEFRGYVRTGVLLWVVAVILPLLQFL